jgi:hypothetical protein
MGAGAAQREAGRGDHEGRRGGGRGGEFGGVGAQRDPAAGGEAEQAGVGHGAAWRARGVEDDGGAGAGEGFLGALGVAAQVQADAGGAGGQLGGGAEDAGGGPGRGVRRRARQPAPASVGAVPSRPASRVSVGSRRRSSSGRRASSGWIRPPDHRGEARRAARTVVGSAKSPNISLRPGPPSGAGRR